ncbi:MAG: chorismate synthase [Planctomycetes bacterium]|nr:chorismate synthase [Planctomycetota bacterium]
MSFLDYRTAGESHGPVMLALVEGMPAGVRIDTDLIDHELRRRQGGFGRSARQKIEKDQIIIKSGVRRGITIGSPIVLELVNRDHRIDQAPAVTRPRPGHADLAGSVKWLTTDCRETLERASARETAARVAAGALAKCLLKRFGIVVGGFVRQIGSAKCHVERTADLAEIIHARADNEVYCPDPQAAEAMVQQIKQAAGHGDTVGGVVEVWVTGVPPGLGSCVRWQDKLDGRLMQAVGSIQAFKGVEIGAGFAVAGKFGSDVHDEMDYDPDERDSPSLGFTRRSNNAGGLEGGMTNGQTVIVRGVMKPISTLARGLDTVDLETKEPARSAYERSDICAVPAASVVAENVVAFEFARALLAKFGGDTLDEVREAYDHYLRAARALGLDKQAE